MKARLDSSVHSLVKSDGLATTQAHVGNGAAVGSAVGSGSFLGLCSSVFSSPVDTTNNVAHGAGAVGAKDLDSDNGGVLGHAILARTDGASDVSSVAIGIDVYIVLRNGLAPL